MNNNLDGQLKVEAKGVWIPICIWDNDDLTLQEKAILVKTESFKECFASNEYLAEFVNVSVSRVKQILKSLADKGYIYRSNERKNQRVVKRVIAVNKVKFYGIEDKTENCPKEELGQEAVSTKDRKLSQVRTGSCPYSNKGNNKGNNKDTPNPQGGDEGKANTKAKAQAVVDLYNEVCGDQLPKAIALNPKRQRQIENVCKIKLNNGKTPFANYNLKAWHAYFDLILENKWNLGENPSNWKADIDYAIRPDTVIKTLERKYA